MSWNTTLSKRVEDLDVSVDGKHIVIALSDMLGRFWQGAVSIRGTDNGKTVFDYPTTGGISAVAWCRKDKDLFFAAGDDGSVNQYKTGKEKALQSGSEHEDAVVSLAINPVDGTSLVSASYDRTIKIWALKTNQSERTFNGHLAAVHDVRWQPKSTDIFGSTGADGSVKLWDRRAPAPTASVEVKENAFSLDWSWHDNPILAVGAAGSLVRAYDFRNLTEPIISHAVAGSKPCRRVRFSPTRPDVLVAGNDDGGVSVFSLATKESKRSQAHQNSVRAIAFHPTQNSFYSGGWDKKVVAHLLE